MTKAEIAAGGYGALLVEKFDSNPEMPTIVYEANLAFEAGVKWVVEQAWMNHTELRNSLRLSISKGRIMQNKTLSKLLTLVTNAHYNIHQVSMDGHKYKQAVKSIDEANKLCIELSNWNNSMQNNWIKCSERLPEDAEFVLLCDLEKLLQEEL